jgi:hypothetical protein
MLRDLGQSVVRRTITFALLFRASWVSSAHQLEALNLAELAEVIFEVIFINPMRQVLEVQVVPDHRILELFTQTCNLFLPL